MRMVKTPKNRMVWTIIALPLVVKLPNSTMREFPGSWKSSPGERRMKSSNPNRTGAQSNIVYRSGCSSGTGDDEFNKFQKESIYRAPVEISMDFNFHRRGSALSINLH
ncbi:unnamed protein product [Citrullus colocynthis]|uniref:Uncharacterized protein n=1 Tax=Citrullus colocynthis TaxID=252529 RepID=A0ABP0Z673_9ROSI